MSPRVIAALDCGPVGEAVLRWADRQALAAGSDGGEVADLVTMTAWPPPRRPDLVCAAAARDEALQAVARALPPDRAAAVSVQVVPDGIVGALVRYARPEDLVVLGRCPGDLHRGATAERLVERAACPVAVVSTGAGGAEAERRTGRVVVGVDGSPAARAALRWAVGRVQRTGGTVVAVTAWRWRPDYPVHPYAPEQRLRQREAHRTLDREVRALGDMPFVQRHVVWGPATDVLLHESAAADLLVVGSAGVDSREDIAFGSVSRALSAQAEVPVVVVRPAAAARRALAAAGAR